MIKRILLLSLFLGSVFIWSCKPSTGSDGTGKPGSESAEGNFKYVTEHFADLMIIRYRIPGWDKLSLKEKELLFCLSQAATSGRDIIYDQNYKHNLLIRRTLENIYTSYKGNKGGDNWTNFSNYLKRVWFSNGIHHHYSSSKFLPEFSAEYFSEIAKASDPKGFPLDEGQSLEELIAVLSPILFDPKIDAKRVNKGEGVDMVTESANNFYEGMTQEEGDKFYDDLAKTGGEFPISFGLNSKLMKKDGKIFEMPWKVGGMYGEAIEKIVFWLKKASAVAENPKQAKTLDLLVDYYETGDLKKFDEYNINWVEDTISKIDFINGFIEVYGDPQGRKGAFESVVNMKDMDASSRMQTVSKNVQWFEDNSSIMEEHKKKKVKGVSYKVITVVNESGDASPSTPIGINLPNATWIRKVHGSKSVSLGNIEAAYKEGKGKGSLEEFCFSDEEVKRAKKYGSIAGKMHTALHEVVGHASGQINEGVGTPKETLKNYASTLEEGRADLVALFFMLDPKLVELGLIETLDVGKSEYDSYIRNGMMVQLRRLKLGDMIEEDHMRNRQLVASWVYEKGAKDNVIEKVKKNGSTHFKINDYQKLKVLFGELLREIQRITSEGDYEAGKALVENYGVKVDQELHAEILKRSEKLDSAPYGGFINPQLVEVKNAKGEVTDIKVTYPDDFSEQHLFYSKEYSFLPTKN